MTELSTKTDLITTLKDSNQRAENWFLAIPANAFFKRQGAGWSPSDNVDHLIKAVKFIVLAAKSHKHQF